MPCRNLGDLGVYNIKPDGTLTLLTPGRKYSSKKDTGTPGEFYLDEVDPHDVRVGDIIDVSGYRKTHSYIVALNPQKKLVLVPLSTTGSGYGIIPSSVTSLFKNAINAFGDKADIHDIHVLSKDKGLRDYFFKGNAVPRAYAYVYHPVTDTVDVTDHVSGRTLMIDRSGRRLGPYLRKMFKTAPTDVLRFDVIFDVNPQRQAEVDELWTEVQHGTKSEQQYHKLKDAHDKAWRAFREKKRMQIDAILIKNYVTAQYGAYNATKDRYTARGTKTALEKTRKALVRLDETTPAGSIRIQLA